MPRIARIVIPNIPHHVTQRGNRRQRTFFEESDYKFYLNHLQELSLIYSVKISAYCLMPNHVHLILTPTSKETLTCMISELHQRYTRYINFKNNWRGHLWQGRYFSVPLDAKHFEMCKLYLKQNPVRAGIVDDSKYYAWLYAEPSYYEGVIDEDDIKNLRRMTRTGRPTGDEDFLNHIKQVSGVEARPRKRGPKV